MLVNANCALAQSADILGEKSASAELFGEREYWFNGSLVKLALAA